MSDNGGFADLPSAINRDTWPLFGIVDYRLFYSSIYVHKSIISQTYATIYIRQSQEYTPYLPKRDTYSFYFCSERIKPSLMTQIIVVNKSDEEVVNKVLSINHREILKHSLPSELILFLHA